MTCVLRPIVRTTYPDKGEHRPVRGFESAWGDPDRELACQVSHGGMLRGVATWTFGGFLAMPPFNLAILPGQNGRVKNDTFEPLVAFWI